jgi:hypothetical protein
METKTDLRHQKSTHLASADLEAQKRKARH